MPGTIPLEEESLAGRLQEIGFRCRRCGECCRGSGENLVMVMPPEIRRLRAATGRPSGDLVEPYPERVALACGASLTFGWALRRGCDGNCRFHAGDRCEVYPARPWICRTYPFLLDGEELRVSSCAGLGLPLGREEALDMARDLLLRREEERDEVERVRSVLSRVGIPAGGSLLVDSEGVHPL
jgi:hypothetical protein